MNFITKFILIILIITFSSCSKKEIKESLIKENSLDAQVLEAYNEGLVSLKNGDVLFAAKKFNEAEMLFPQSDSAPKSAIMAAYAYYSQDYLDDSIAELNRIKQNKAGIFKKFQQFSMKVHEISKNLQ